MRSAVVVVLLAVLAGVACGGGDDAAVPDDLVGATAEVHVYDAWVPPTSDDDADLSMRVHNSGPQDDRLLEATCACAASVEIVGAVVVAPEQEIVVAPGDTPGLRLRGLTEPLRRGNFVSVTLTFEQAGPVTAEVEIRPAA